MKRVMFIGIAGTDKDFLLSVPTLVCYLNQFKEITDNYQLLQFHYYKSTKLDEIISDINKFEPDIICYSQYIWNKQMIIDLTDWFSGVPSIIGGPDISKNYSEGLKFYITGEGEYELYSMLTGKLAPKQPYRDRPSIYKDKTFIEILKTPNIRVNIETQRGCTFKCSYCLYHKNMPNLEYRNVNTVLDELEFIQQSGIKEIRIIDGNFFSNYTHAHAILSGLLTRNINLKIFFESSPILINDNLLELCKQYIEKGNKLLMSIGIQSTNKKSLKAINRFRNEEVEEEMIDKLSKIGISLRIDSILGLPYDNVGTYLETLNTIIKYMEYGKHYMGPNVLRILPNTELDNEVILYGMHCNESYLVTSNNFMDEEDMKYCLRKTAIAFRLFSSYNLDNNSEINDEFFKTKYRTNYSNLEILRIIEDALIERLKGTDSDFLKEDFPNAEDYYYWQIRFDAPDEWLKEIMRNTR